MALSDLVTEILSDHKIIRKLYEPALTSEATLVEKKEIFEELAIVVTAHSKSEEATLYAPTSRIDETKKEAFKGFEEHGLIELLVEELNSEKNDEKWEAKFTVVCELLEKHLENEEEDYIPLIEDVFSSEERVKLGKEYRKMFDQFESAQRKILRTFRDRELDNH